MSDFLKEIFENNFLPSLLSVIAVAITTSTILKYLNSSKEYSRLFKKIKKEQEENVENKKRKSIENLIKSAVSDEEKQEYLLKLFRTEINNKINLIDEKLENDYKNKSEPEFFRYNQLIENFDNIRKRLLNELSSLTKRANLNLTIGIVSSIIAMAFLFYSGIYTTIDYEEKWFNFITYYIPKLSLLIFLGTFSFYFLNLYKSNLSVIQNYQNDLNDVEFKIISITTSILSSDENKEAHLNELVKTLAINQWNRILKDGESTVELQKLKENNYFDKEVILKLWTMNQMFNKDNNENK